MSTSAPRHASRGPGVSRRLLRGLVVATTVTVVAVAGVVTMGAAPRDRGVAAPAKVLRAGTDSAVAKTATGSRTGAATPERPRRVRLPSGKVVPVLPVATTKDGTLAVPGDVNRAGWWRGGSRVGDPFGSALLAAHVDSSTQGLGPYAELLTVTAGQSIVLTSRHLRQRYVVRSLQLMPKGSLSAHPRIYSARGPHRVTMVTCAGPFRPAKGGYQRLAVVTATAVGRPTRR